MAHLRDVHRPGVPVGGPGTRRPLVGDAAGLINPPNGAGIQYSLHSARWAADIAADRLSSGRVNATSLAGYEQRALTELTPQLTRAMLTRNP